MSPSGKRDVGGSSGRRRVEEAVCSNHLYTGQRPDEVAALRQIGLILPDDGIGILPRQNYNVVWFSLQQCVRGQDGHMVSRAEKILPCGIIIHDEFKHRAKFKMMD